MSKIKGHDFTLDGEETGHSDHKYHWPDCINIYIYDDIRALELISQLSRQLERRQYDKSHPIVVQLMGELKYDVEELPIA